MHIPLDNLYHWIDGMLPEPSLVYLFYPHGSKSILDISRLKNYEPNHFLGPTIICHDQEPLDFDYYQNQCHTESAISLVKEKYFPHFSSVTNIDNVINCINQSNLSFVCYNLSIFDKCILLHSEINSIDVEKYKNSGYIDVFWWSHAVIARDWFRFAEIDHRLDVRRPITKTFLIYNRAWGGNREYRLKFAELLVEQNLHLDSLTSIQKNDDYGLSFKNFQFKNNKFQLTNIDILDQLEDNTYTSDASADYQADDFKSTNISVVLETIFDSEKIHLTEKILKPIACGHPFILVSSPGSLKFLKTYGFKTFDDFIDESYDDETDSVERLKKIIKLMKSISDLTAEKKNELFASLQPIVEYNKKLFFSDIFFNRIKGELNNGLLIAFDEVKKTRGHNYLNEIKHISKHAAKFFINFNEIRKQKLRKLRNLRKNNFIFRS
jgi:hypothetical protein